MKLFKGFKEVYSNKDIGNKIRFGIRLHDLETLQLFVNSDLKNSRIHDVTHILESIVKSSEPIKPPHRFIRFLKNVEIINVNYKTTESIVAIVLFLNGVFILGFCYHLHHEHSFIFWL